MRVLSIVQALLIVLAFGLISMGVHGLEAAPEAPPNVDAAPEKPLAPPDDEEFELEPVVTGPNRKLNPIAQRYAKEAAAHGSILFAGSSSIEKWKSLATDFDPLPVVNRGVGGSTIHDWLGYFETIVKPAAPKTLVFYCGDNDIAGGIAPAEVAKNFKTFAGLVHSSFPETKILFVSMKPSPLRANVWPKMQDAGHQIQTFAQSTRYITYVDVAPVMLRNNKPMPELFGSDKLHMNAQGYALWTKLLKPYLEK